MTERTILTRVAVLISAGLLTLLMGACQTGNGGSTETSTSTPPPFPYPPFEIRTDVAVPLEPPLDDAARFALQMSVDERLSNDPDEEALYQRYRSKIASQADGPRIRVQDTYAGQTGAALHRAVAARVLPDGDVEVSICLYDTPGLYAMKEDGTLVRPTPVEESLWRPRVKWTAQPAADGSTPSGPRWLLMDSGVLTDLTPDQVAAVCDPFKPEPFIQEPPRPTSAAPK